MGADGSGGWPARQAATVLLGAALVLTACDGGGSPRASDTPAPTPTRPLPTTTAALLERLDELADRLETKGDGIAAQQERAQACIELERVRKHVASYDERLLHEKLELQLDVGSKVCGQGAGAAADRLREVISGAPETPVGATPE